MVASGVAQGLELFILTCLRNVSRRPTFGRIPLDEWSARRRDLYLTKDNTHNRQTNIHVPGGIRAHNLSRRAAEDLRLRPRGHWDRHDICNEDKIYSSILFRNDVSYMIQPVARSRQLHNSWAHTVWDVFNTVNCILLLFRNVDFNFALPVIYMSIFLCGFLRLIYPRLCN
jgi:hypothetical protein